MTLHYFQDYAPDVQAKRMKFDEVQHRPCSGNQRHQFSNPVEAKRFLKGRSSNEVMEDNGGQVLPDMENSAVDAE